MAFRRPSGRSPVPAGSAFGGGPEPEFAQAALAHIDSLYGTALRLTRRASATGKSTELIRKHG